MADGTHIEWTDATWNPVTGCSIVSPGCTNCYAMKLAGTRLKHTNSRKGLTMPSKSGPVWNGQVRLNEEWLFQPLEWKRPRMIFVCAHGDLFAENVPDEWIDKVFAVMAMAPQHTFQVLTKRAERMRDYLRYRFSRIVDAMATMTATVNLPDWPLPNVWLGVSTEDQKRADERIPFLLDTPASVRWISAEPLLGPINLAEYLRLVIHKPGSVGKSTEIHLQIIRHALDWIVVGGESGPGARPMHPTWVRSIRDQCAAAGVPLFFKQWGAWKPVPWKLDRHKDETDAEYVERSERECSTFAISQSGYLIEMDHKPWSWARVLPAPSSHHSVKLVGKKAAGRLLDGIVHDAFPKIERTV